MDTSLILSVTDVNQHLKGLISQDELLASVFVRGELSNYKLHSSGHAYMTMKDEGGVLRAVMFRGSASRLKFRPDNGMKVIAHGRIDVFPRDGQYQLYIDDLIPDGIGALYIAYEQLKEKLGAEGLFDPMYKKPIPRCPARIALVTSPTGAAVRDMLRILRARWPIARVRIYPVRVQGPEAPAEICEGIRFVNEHRLADVIITGRGGGSIEDLWAFNDEMVAREIFASQIPVISAVGHEPDFTIVDFVADLRAATPSNAAELAVPDRAELAAQLRMTQARILQLGRARVTLERQRVAALAGKRVLTSPMNYIEDRAMALDHLSRRFEDMVQRGTTTRRDRLARAAGMLDALSPMRVLARGYAMATTGDGTILRDAAQLHPEDTLTLRLERGGAVCRVQEIIEGEQHGSTENDI
ncbi:MAG: exodeoxyribonuclease VII large subunit [Ruminococcaceae bacterium]|nr:exodeoxyribonuclease VII large subunit [Oscillospiraceae bacterium]